MQMSNLQHDATVELRGMLRVWFKKSKSKKGPSLFYLFCKEYLAIQILEKFCFSRIEKKKGQ